MPLRYLAVILLWAANVLAAQSLPTRALFDRPKLDLLRLSADGSKLVGVVREKNHQFLQEIDPTTLRPTPLAHFEDSRVADVWWKGNDRILFVVDYGDWDYAWRAIDVSTKKVDSLNLLNTWRIAMVNQLRDNPDEVVVMTSRRAICRFNLRTGKLKELEHDLGGVTQWLTDREGTPVAATATRRDHLTLWWRPNVTAKWAELDLGLIEDPVLTVYHAHPDGRRLIAWDHRSGEIPAVVGFDPATNAKELLFQASDVEPDNVLLWSGDNSDAKAIGYETEVRQRHYFDEKAAALQASIDAALPDTWNSIVSMSRDWQRAVILSESERDAGHYYLLDRGRRRLAPLGPRYEGHAGITFGSGRAFTFQARDGMKLHGRLVLPAKASKPPLVVLTGGYFANYRARGEFDVLKQLFATRDIAVVNFDTRGTLGRGRAYAEAGNYQVHDAIPKDVVDGVRWLVAQGLVDEKRIAIMGESLGGVIAIHALREAPDLFHTWINWNTPVRLGKLKYDDYATAARTWRAALDDLGGRRGARMLESAVDPGPAVAHIKIPSIHYYSRGMSQEGEMQNLLKKSGALHVMLPDEPANTSQQYADHISQVFDEILRFIEQRFAID